MNRRIAPECRAQFGGGQFGVLRHVRRQRPKLAASVARAIGGAQQQPGDTGGEHPLDLDEAHRGLAGAARQADQVAAPCGQQRLDPVGQGIVDDRPAGARRARTAFSRPPSATISRRAVNHKPRPGKRPATSGTIAPSGDTTNRTSSAFGRISPVTKQRRVAPLVVVIEPPRGRPRIVTPVPPLPRASAARFVREPMRARLHDDGVGLFEVQLVDRLGDFHQLVAGEIGEIVERLHALLAQRDQQRRR